MIKFVDAEDSVHFVRPEDIRHIEIYKSERLDDEGKVKHWGYVFLPGEFVSLNKKGAKLLQEQLDES